MSETDLVVVKIGGSTLGQHDTTLDDLVELQERGVPLVVVHGGGRAISDWQKRLRLEPKFVDGLRVTDEDTLDVAVAVLAGLINKQLVGALMARDGRAVGLGGVDGGLLRAEVQDPRLGRVGVPASVDHQPLRALLDAGYIPVVAPIGLGPSGQLLNVNADTAAGEIAAGMGARKLVFLTDVPGVLGREGALIAQLNATEARRLVDSGVISGGMIPKVSACLRGAESGGETHIVDGRVPHSLLDCLAGRAKGTTITHLAEDSR